MKPYYRIPITIIFILFAWAITSHKVFAEIEWKTVLLEEEWNSLDNQSKELRQKIPLQGTILYKDKNILDRWSTDINEKEYPYINIIAKDANKYQTEFQASMQACNSNKDTFIIFVLGNRCTLTLTETHSLIQDNIKQVEGNDTLASSLRLTNTIKSLGQFQAEEMSIYDIILSILGPLSLILIVYYYFIKLKI